MIRFTTRRDFLVSAGATVMSGCVGIGSRHMAHSGERIRFSVFADIHYMPGVFPNDTPAHLDKVLARAHDAGSDFIIQLGDFTHAPEKYADYVRRYNDCGIPAFHVLGNHDTEQSRYEAVKDAYLMPDGHYFFDRGGFRFIVLDTNWAMIGGKWTHYHQSNYTTVPFAQAWRVPPFEQEWLKEVLAASPHPCVVFSHQSMERAVKGSPDGEAVRRIFNEANARRPGLVRLVLNGHHHIDNLRILDGIVYFDVNSANYKWYGQVCKKYPADYLAKYKLANMVIAWEDPLNAVITMGAGGEIEIEGMCSRFMHGVSPADAGLPVEFGGRAVTPAIQSASFRMEYGMANG